MNQIKIASRPSGARNDGKEILSWGDNPAVQKLLDVVISIMAEEYIEVARKNRGVFEIASGPSVPRNDGERKEYL